MDADAFFRAMVADLYLRRMVYSVVLKHERTRTDVDFKTMAEEMVRRARKRNVALTEGGALHLLQRYDQRREDVFERLG